MPELARQSDVTSPADRPGLLAPDTSGMNYPFRLTENPVQRAIADHLLGERAVGMAEVGELLSSA